MKKIMMILLALAMLASEFAYTQDFQIPDKPIARLETELVLSVSFSPDGRLLASGSGDNTIKLWDVQNKREVDTLKGHTDWIYSVSFSPDGRLLASGSKDNTIKLWDVQSRQEVVTLRGHTGRVYSVSFSPDGRLLASGSGDNTIKLWDVQSRREVDTLRGHTSTVDSVSLSPDGRLLASGSEDNTIKLWDVQNRRRLDTLKGHTDLIYSVSFSPDGRLLASGSRDNTIKLWDVQSRREVNTLKGTNMIYSVSFSPDGRLLASGLFDNTIKLWDVQSKREVDTLKGHTNFVTSVSFSPDYRLLASGSLDGTILLWEIGVTPNPVFRISPADKTVNVGDEFTLDIIVEDAQNLFGASFELTFDGNILQAIEAIPWDFLGEDVVFFTMPEAHAMTVSISKKAGSMPATGTGLLAKVTFKAKKAGTTDIGFRPDTLSLQQADGSPIPQFESLDLRECHVIVEGVDFSMKVEPEEATVVVGGKVTYEISVTNLSSVKNSFDIGVSEGLSPNLYTLSKSSLSVSPGATQEASLYVSIPKEYKVEQTQTIKFEVSAKSDEYKKSVPCVLHIEPHIPFIRNLLPRDGAYLTSNDVIFSWNTYIDATSEVYLKAEGEAGYKSYTGAEGKSHFVNVTGLERNKRYSYYVKSTCETGSDTSKVRTFFISSGIAFTQDAYSFTVERDYNQQVAVAVSNVDSNPHELLVEIENPYNDIITGFIGEGSENQIVQMNPGESKDVTLVFHAQNTQIRDYQFIITVSSSGISRTLLDTALVKIHVDAPLIDYEIVELSADPYTLAKNYRIVNHGDAITDLKVETDENLRDKVMFQPSFEHAYLRSGGSLEFKAIPILSAFVEEPSTPRSGKIIASCHDTEETIEAGFQCPSGKNLYEEMLSNVMFIAKAADSHCTNNPNFVVRFEIPAGFDVNDIKKATLIVNFIPKTRGKRHNVYVFFNEHQIGQILDSVPEGPYFFNIEDASYFILPEFGVAVNTVRVKTERMNQGNYVLTTDFELHIVLDKVTFYVCASNEKEADAIVASQTTFVPQPDWGITIDCPKEEQRIMIGSPFTIEASSPSGTSGLYVVASFSNGDASIPLNDQGNGLYSGEWTPQNPGEEGTGNAIVTVTAGACRNGEAQCMVRLIEPIFIAKKYMPNILQLQYDIDTERDNALIKIGYHVSDEGRNKVRIEYSLVFKDEDDANLDELYDFFRDEVGLPEFSGTGRIQDIETVAIVVDIDSQRIDRVDFRGTDEYPGSWADDWIYWDPQILVHNVIPWASKEFTDISQFEQENEHINIYVATWNHLFSNRKAKGGPETGIDWIEMAHTLGDDKFVNKSRKELELEYAHTTVDPIVASGIYEILVTSARVATTRTLIELSRNIIQSHIIQKPGNFAKVIGSKSVSAFFSWLYVPFFLIRESGTAGGGECKRIYMVVKVWDASSDTPATGAKVKAYSSMRGEWEEKTADEYGEVVFEAEGFLGTGVGYPIDTVVIDYNGAQEIMQPSEVRCENYIIASMNPTVVDAKITDYKIDIGAFGEGDKVNAEVKVKNTGNEEHKFYVGYSVRDKNGQWWNAPYGSINLQSGKEGSISLSWIVKSSAPEGYYTARVAVWEDEAGGLLIDRRDYKEKEYAFRIVEHPWDVNGDSIVDISDLVIVGMRFGEKITTPAEPNPDVNRDGVVDISDLILVGQHFGEEYEIKSPASPTQFVASNKAKVWMVPRVQAGDRLKQLLTVDVKADADVSLSGFQFDIVFDPTALEAVSVADGTLLKGKSNTFFTSPKIDNQTGIIKGIACCTIGASKPTKSDGILATITFKVKDTAESALSLQNTKLVDADARSIMIEPTKTMIDWNKLLIPEKSALLQNFPNPFNPETWIPYQLAEPASVVIDIYNVKGQLVRRLDLGYCQAGIYTNKARAAHWDGRNNSGEKVASGVYFYQMKASSFSTTRKLVILK
jgi:hypothetical protein